MTWITHSPGVRTVDTQWILGGHMETVDLPAVGFLVADLGRPRSLAPGEILFLEGDHSASVYAVVEGRIRLFVSLPSGQELLLGMKTAGDEFGELSAIDGRPRSASAMATDRSIVAELPSDRFLSAISDRPEYWLSVCQSLSAQLRRANDRLIARNSSSATVRTGRMLIELASLMMRHGDGGTVFELPMTQSDLAESIGATRESTARALAQFRRAGLIETCRGRIVVHDVLGLDQLLSTA